MWKKVNHANEEALVVYIAATYNKSFIFLSNYSLHSLNLKIFKILFFKYLNE